jgi:hypothetical protein
MEITNDGIEFTSEDAQLWRAFLRTRAGERLIPKLLESTPPALESGESNAIFIRQGKMLGFQEAARVLLALAYPSPALKPPATEYPGLLDDSAWNDGQKIETPK